MNIEKTQNLLSHVSSLLKNYEKLAKSTGENFNIFSVMGMERDEVKTHSRIIAELLNPKGSHSHGCTFLKYFFEEIEELNSIVDFNFEKANVKIEEHIGEINKEYTVGGYIDIVIDDGNNNIIVIENKIDAPDQKGQLLRYRNHYNDCKLIYLTKNGKKPSEESYFHSDKKININLEDIILVCYKNKILSWIDRCHKEAIQQPMLREMLKQYSNLLKKLTHQTINNELKMEISNLIKNNFLEASEIANNFNEAKSKIIDTFFEDVFKTVKESSKDLLIDISKELHGKIFNFLLSKENWKHSFIYLRIENNQIFYGITVKDLKNNTPSIQGRKNEYPSLYNFKPGKTSVIFNTNFAIKIDDAKKVKEIIDEKNTKMKEAVNFIESLLPDLISYCEYIEQTIN